MNIDCIVTMTHVTDLLGWETCIPVWNLFQDDEYVTKPKHILRIEGSLSLRNDSQRNRH